MTHARIRPLGMLARLILAFAVVLAPLGLFSAWSYQQLLSDRRDASRRDATESARTAAALVHGLLRDLDGTTLALAQGIGSRPLTEPLTQANVGSALAAVSQRYPFLRGLFLTDAQGTVVASKAGDGIGLDLRDRPYTRALLDAGQEFVLTNATPGIQTTTPTVTLARTVRAPDGTLRGIIAASFYPDQLADLFPGGLAADADLTVYDRAGFLLYSSATPDVPNERRDQSGDLAVQRALDRQVAVAQTSASPLDGQQRFGAVAPVPEYGWAVGLSRNVAAVDGATHRIYRWQTVLLAALTLGAAGLALALSRALSHPLVELAAQARALGRGERVLPPPRGGPPEVRTLAAALGQMAADVDARFAEREQAEATRRYLAAIVESSEDAIFGKTLDAIITSWNVGAERMYGYTASEAIGRSVTMLAPPERSNEIPALMERIRRGEPIARYETERIRKDGARLVVLLSISPIRDSAGQLIGAATIAHDVTEHRRIEAALHQSEERFRTMAETAHEGIWLLDRELRTIFANQRLADLLGTTIEALADRRLLESCWPEDVSAVEEQLRVTLAGQPAQCDVRFRRADGTPVPMLASTSAVRDRTGAITGVLGLFSDMTERAQLAAARDQALAQAQQALATRDEFLFSLSHDLRTPLAMVSGFAQLLARQLERLDIGQAPRMRAQAEGIDRAVGTMLSMLDELLDLARLDAGRSLELRRRTVDLVALVKSCAEEQRRMAHGHVISVQSDPPVIEGEWDGVRLGRVVTNLLSNAIKYSPAGGMVTVTLAREEDGGAWAVLAVSDQGIGIPAADLPHVFERFHRASNVTAAIAGIGIGLASARQIVEHHGGVITVTSVEGQGATFTVRLPLSEPATPAACAT